MPRKTFRKIIVTDDLLKSVNPTNLKLMKKFLQTKDAKSSDKTIENYESDLNIFFVWNVLENQNRLFTEIRKLQLADFFNYCLTELKWGSARFSRMRSVLSSFSQFLEKYYDEEYPNFRNIVLNAVESMPKNPVREKTVLTDEQINNLFKYLKDNNKKQEACWLALAIASGSRFSELFRFTVDILDENNTAFDGLFMETLKTIKTKGRTKNGKSLYKYIIKDLFLPYYKDWLEEREEILSKTQSTTKSLFIKKTGEPATDGVVRGWIEEFEKYLGIDLYPHCLRHYATTYLAKIGLPSTLIKELFGWESEDMVSTYNDTEAKDRKWEELGLLKTALDKM